MMKIFISLAIFIWAFYSYADCQTIQSPVNSKTKLFKTLNEKTPNLVDGRFERVGNIEKVLVTEKCFDKVTVRFQTAVKSIKTGKTKKNKYFCSAQASLVSNDIFSARCLAPKSESSSSSDYEGPSAYPYGDINDPFSGNNSNSGSRYGDEPEFPSRNGDGPDSYNDSDLF